MAANNTARSRLSRLTRHVSFWLAAALLTVAGTGCRLTQPAGASFASVKIKDHTPAQIQAAAVQVFREDGYAAFEAGPGQMVFQKEASKMTNIGQNGFVGSYYGAQTLVRVRAQIVDLGTGSCRLQCQAYFVRNPGDSFMEDEHPLINARRLPFQHLLNKVAGRLKAP
jgi:hypothetical protein